jgi:hypothetical protein
VEELGRVVPLLPRPGRHQVVVVAGLELLLVVSPLERHLVPEHHVHVAVVGHADQLAVVAEHQLLVDVGDVVELEIELELLGPRFQRLEVAAVVGHVAGPEHDQVPGAAAAVELQQRLRHEGVEGDDLHFELDAQLVVQVLLDQRQRVLHVFRVDHRPDRRSLVRAIALGGRRPRPQGGRHDGDEHERDPNERESLHERISFGLRSWTDNGRAGFHRPGYPLVPPRARPLTRYRCSRNATTNAGRTPSTTDADASP